MNEIRSTSRLFWSAKIHPTIAVKQNISVHLLFILLNLWARSMISRYVDYRRLFERGEKKRLNDNMSNMNDHYYILVITDQPVIWYLFPPKNGTVSSQFPWGLAE